MYRILKGLVAWTLVSHLFILSKSTINNQIQNDIFEIVVVSFIDFRHVQKNKNGSILNNI